LGSVYMRDGRGNRFHSLHCERIKLKFLLNKYLKWPATVKPLEVKERRVMKSVVIVSLSTKTLKCPNLVPLTELQKMTMVMEGITATTESQKIAAKAMVLLRTTACKMEEEQTMETSHPAIALKKDARSVVLDGTQATWTKAKIEEFDAETADLAPPWAPAALVAALAAVALVAIAMLAARSAKTMDPSLKCTSLVSPERQDARILRPISLVAATTFSM